MNWEDELIEDCREDDGTLHPQTDHVLSGAHWMLRRLRTDEAIERAAEAVYECGEAGPYDEPGGWEHENEFNRMNSTRMAKHIITALLGDD